MIGREEGGIEDEEKQKKNKKQKQKERETEKEREIQGLGPSINHLPKECERNIESELFEAH